jgi:tetratricopeptide (TPR) repeat protein
VLTPINIDSDIVLRISKKLDENITDKHILKMKGLIYISALALWITTSASGQEIFSSRTDSLIQLGIRLSIQQSYPQAIDIFSAIEAEMPESPGGYFFHAAVLQSQMMDYEIYDQEKEFLDLITRTINYSKSYLKKNREDAWGYFFLGGGYAYLAFYQAKQKKWVEAFQNGRRSVRALKSTLRADSTFYDAYFGLGIYKYYRSKFSRYFSWLPFVNDERAEGIQMIRTAIAKSRYSRYSAINSLGWIALGEGNYEEGWRTLNLALQEFPESRVFLWCAAKLAAKLERWSEAVEFYQKILHSLKAEGVLSPFNELICRKNLHHLYLEMENFQQAKEECEQIHKILFDKESQKRCAPILRELENACSQYALGAHAHR